ncbi:distal tail protein Dit [Clostridium sp. FAM 1755]|uniref:distal tail protein Dit n=1 Tax=Clostridium TaxID=1485 RepID=UPI002901F836|nr:phage tail protein [Clostridium botulinum]
MEDGFIWKGIHSSEKGLRIISLPDITTPEQRVEKVVVPGRSGDLTLTDNDYEGEVKPVEFDYFNNNFDDIKTWLSGTGEVIFSNEPDRYYKARIINKIALNQVLKKFHSGIVQFDCQPFGYSRNDSSIIKITEAKEINNPGTGESTPVITIYGYGNIDLNINDNIINLTNVSNHIIIDSEIMDCYRDGQLMNNYMKGKFPIFKVGINKISWRGNVQRLEIKPNWRWL